jgi:neutral amino acid transport system ATP-binding protein
MLTVKNLSGGYTKNIPVLNGIDFKLDPHSSLAVFGQNGAGKSTIAKAIVGLLPYCEGVIEFKGQSILHQSPEAIANSGIGFYWQGGKVFPHLSVRENLQFAAGKLSNKTFSMRWDKLCREIQSFNALKQKPVNQQATYLSGGERHLLALGMLLIRKPELLILDEPSAGLAPSAVGEIYSVLSLMQQLDKTTILLIEQNIDKAASFCKSCFVLKSGCISRSFDLRLSSSYDDVVKELFDTQTDNSHYAHVDCPGHGDYIKK